MTLSSIIFFLSIVSASDNRFLEIARQIYPLSISKKDFTNRFAESLEAADLGHRLFFEKRFSKNNDISCATCHRPKLWFTDNLKVPSHGFRNTPTVVDAFSRRWFFWDGRSDSQWGQALQPIESMHEHGGSRWRAVKVIVVDDFYRKKYESLFGSLKDADGLFNSKNFIDATPLSEVDSLSRVAWEELSIKDKEKVNVIFSNIGKSLAAYQRRLESLPSGVHKWAKSLLDKSEDKKIFTLDQKIMNGMDIFYGKAQCFRCHSGPNFTDEEFHSIGLISYIGLEEDSGRWEGVDRLLSDDFNSSSIYSDNIGAESARLRSRVLKDARDWGRFRTPSLKNVSKTAPYMHDGRFATLKEVVEHYNTLEKAVFPEHHGETMLSPLGLTNTEVTDLILFLEALESGPKESKWFNNPKSFLDSIK